VGSTKVIVPKAASVFCALGMLESDIRLDHVKTYNATIPGIDLNDFNQVTAAVEKQALAELLQEGVHQDVTTLLRYLDVRYIGQHHEVTVEIPGDCLIEESHLEEIAETFHKAHEMLYTYSTRENPIEIMNLRITAVGAVEKTGMEESPVSKADAADAVKASRMVYLEDYQGKNGYFDVPVYDRDKLRPGSGITGPAIVEERITTIVVHPGWTLTVDGYENIVMEVVK
ncbi:MAG: hydantoinase/oxoprolinase family protein, partial [Spirochaetales bacterium]|nr:hydantoinase/oxoprolinase family protein [Spirochaetales bacterium]